MSEKVAPDTTHRRIARNDAPATLWCAILRTGSHMLAAPGGSGPLEDGMEAVTRASLVPAAILSEQLPCESQISVQRMEMTEKHVFIVQTQIDKGSSLEPQVMTCQQHECVYEHRQEENTKTSTTHSHVSKKHCTRNR